MRIKDHIGKISWSFIDKGTYLLFGLFTLYQLKFLLPSQLAFYETMALFNNWIFLLADGLALNGLIQFGARPNSKGKVNLMSISVILFFSLFVSGLIFLSRNQISGLFGDDSIALALYYLPLVSLLTIPRNYTLKILYRELKYFQIFIVNLVFFGAQVLATLYFINEFSELNFQLMIQILIIGAVCSTMISLVVIGRNLKFSLRGDVSWKEFLKFGSVVSFQQVFHSLPKTYDFHIVLFFFGTDKAGIYAAAKKLYKTFDEAASAAHGLIYPTSVKLIAYKDDKGLKDLTTKSLSALFFAFAGLILILNFGLTEWLINSFNLETYSLAIGQFNLLVISGLFLPFALLTPLMNALSKEKIVLRNKIIATIGSISLLLIIGNYEIFELVPLVIITYNFILGTLCYFFVKGYLNLKFADNFRIIKDIKHFVTK